MFNRTTFSSSEKQKPKTETQLVSCEGGVDLQ